MKKQLIIIVLLVGLLSVAYGFESTPQAVTIGDEAPSFSVQNTHTTFAIEDNKGRYTLIAFWASEDAQSRITANEYSRWYRKSTNSSTIDYAAINLDDDLMLYQEIIRQDGLYDRTQYYAGPALAKNLRAAYGISEHYGAILVAPDGRIVAVNPTKHALDTLINA